MFCWRRDLEDVANKLQDHLGEQFNIATKSLDAALLELVDKVNIRCAQVDDRYNSLNDKLCHALGEMIIMLKNDNEALLKWQTDTFNKIEVIRVQVDKFEADMRSRVDTITKPGV